jgi:hypothetical protein
VNPSPIRCRVLTTPRADDLDFFYVKEAEDEFFAKYGIDINWPIEFTKSGWLDKLVDRFFDRLHDYCS